VGAGTSLPVRSTQIEMVSPTECWLVTITRPCVNRPSGPVHRASAVRVRVPSASTAPSTPSSSSARAAVRAAASARARSNVCSAPSWPTARASSTTPAAQVVSTQATKSSSRSVPRARSERARSACL